MNDYILFTDSCCDLPDYIADELELHVVPMPFKIGGKDYFNYLDERSIGHKEFYDLIRSGKSATTASASVGAYEDAFGEVLEQGKDVLCLAFSSALSNTCNAARIASESLSGSYPDRRIYVVDTLSASLGEGLVVYHAAELKKGGADIETVRQWVEDNKLHQSHWFTVDTLKYLLKGGRVSAASAIVGTMAGIKPVMHTDNDGRLTKVSVVRGRKNSLKALMDKMESTGVNLEGSVTAICHSDCLDEANAIAEEMKKRFGVKDVIVNWIGPIIGTHTGPGTIGIFFNGSAR